MRKDQFSRIERGVAAYMAEAVKGVKDPAPYVLKQDHTLRVCGNMRMLARSLDLPREIRNRAAAAGLVHDLGRFPQYRRFGTFSDPLSRNHAALSAGVICSQGILEGLDREERAVMLRAVVLHNRPDLPAGLPRDLDLLARLLRDADKMDIFRVMTGLYAGPENGQVSFITHNLRDDGRVSRTLADMVIRGQRLPYSLVNSLNDMKLFQLSMIYDMNFPAALAHVLEQGVVRTIVRSMPPDRESGLIETALTRYMTGRIGP